MTVDRGKSRATKEAATFGESVMEVRVGVSVWFRNAEVDKVNGGGILTSANQDITGFDISMNIAAQMYVLQATNLYIIRKKENGYEHCAPTVHRLQR